MAKQTLELQKILGCSLWLIGYSEIKNKGVFIPYRKEFEKYYDTTMKLLYDLEHNKKYELIVNSKNISKKERDDIVFIVKLIKRIYTIKFENIVYNYYDDLEFAEPILKSVESEDISLISKRILLLEEILSDLNRNSIRDMSINKLFIKWV